MAWRLDRSVVRGEIDNRERDRVTGTIWLLNRSEPMRLSLQGNCHADMAGCLLEFENPEPGEGDHTDLHPVQEGTVGDMTSSRKVRVFDVPMEEAMRRARAGESSPEHMDNSVYIEWFSQTNGRVVIESTRYHVRISSRTWTLTEEDMHSQGNKGQTLNNVDTAL
jgi:hypothetical protein